MWWERVSVDMQNQRLSGLLEQHREPDIVGIIRQTLAVDSIDLQLKELQLWTVVHGYTREPP
jgi:hypothetical protein